MLPCPLHTLLSGADTMNMTRAGHCSSVDGNGQVRRVDQRRLVPIGARRRGQTTATKRSQPRQIVDLRSEATRMIKLICELFPLCRSVTGDGLRQSLFRLGELIPLEIHEVASGTQVFDWMIPKEWNIQDGYIKDAKGRRVVDFRVNNLHVVNYSGPVNRRMSLGELRPIFIRSPSTTTGSPIAPPTTRTPRASACRTDSSKALRMPNMRWLSIHRFATDLSLMVSACSPAGSTMNS